MLQCPWNEDRDAMSALYGDLLHLDPFDVPHLVFDDPEPVAARVIELGGSIRRRDGFPVYADPAGHPFCLGRPGE